MSLRPLPLILAASQLLLGCRRTEAPSDPAVIGDADRAGVVVSTEQGAWGPGDAWTVREVLSVGDSDSGALDQFGLIAGVDVDGDGNIYVADKQARNVQVFDASGAHLRTIGRAGAGPGEFGSNIGGVFVVGDEVLVPDVSNQRVSRFGTSGGFVGSERIALNQGIPIRWDVAAGRLVAQRRLVVPGDREAAAGDAVVTLGLEGQPVDTIAKLPAGQSVQITGGIPRIRQFQPEAVWDTAIDGRLVAAMTNAWRFEVRNPTGEVEWVAWRPSKAKPVTERHREAVRSSLREMYRRQGVPPDVSGAVIDGMEFAADLPAFASLAFGPAGSLWVQEFTPPAGTPGDRVRVFVGDMGSVEWGVFDSTGHYLGVVTFPVEFQPTRVSGDTFYGIARDELGVQSVKAFRVVMG